MSYAVRRAAFAAVFLFLAAAWIEPTGAFDALASTTRNVGADVVGDASAYVAVTGGTCSLSTAGGPCTFTVTNKGTTPLSFSVSKTTDANSMVLSYALTGVTPVTSGTVATPSPIAVGSSTTLTADVRSCVCSGQTRYVYWQIDGVNTNVLDHRQTLFQMTLNF